MFCLGGGCGGFLPLVARVECAGFSPWLSVQLTIRMQAKAPRQLALRATRYAATRLGFDLVHRDCYSPVPDIGNLPESTWTTRSALPGIRWNEDAQRRYFREVLSLYFEEFEDALAHERLRIDSNSYARVDAAVLFATLRACRPRRVLEVGAGFSTLVAAAAVLANRRDGAACEFVSVDPDPPAMLSPGVEGLASLERTGGEAIDVGQIEQLDRDDVLFVDSTHVAKVGGEVTHVILELLPRLRPGVLIHIHDIFMPWEYPRAFAAERAYCWSEQYLVQALLAGTQDFEVLLATHWLGREDPGLIQELLPGLKQSDAGAALWLRRTGG